VTTAETRAERLVRWYPAAWRERYGEEFAAMLADDIAERPRSVRRTANVAVSGLTARLSVVGLAAGPIRDPQLTLITTGVAIALFAALATSLWAQLAAGGHLTSLDSPAARCGSVVLTVSLAGLAVLALLALLPVVGVVGRAVWRRQARGVAVPSLAIACGTTALGMGGHHMATHWTALAGSGTGTTHIPNGAASFAWAETFGISTFWAHPSMLLALPATRIAWLIGSPLLLIAVVVAFAVLLRRVDLPAPVVRLHGQLARLAVWCTWPMLCVATWWVLASQHDANIHLRAGTLDLAMVGVMTIALAAAAGASDRLPRQA
jgi:hypothetical protein